MRDEARALFRSALLDAAEREFAERGFHGARIQDIARRARVGVGTVYNHFTRKEDMLLELVRQRMSEASRAFGPREGDPADFEGRFRARFGRMHAYLAAHEAFFRVACDFSFFDGDAAAAAAILREPFAESDVHAELARQTRELIAEGIAEGALEPGDPIELERFLTGAMRVLASMALREGGDTGRAFDLTLTLFLRATRRSAPERREP
ncbi:MAG TPA: helix-turn-helix domain-containing protein [Polyangiaceae bacterium]|nr:helix-turn-helix domain-containing protein [Polyangiaceae bacterium]